MYLKYILLSEEVKKKFLEQKALFFRTKTFREQKPEDMVSFCHPSGQNGQFV